MAKFASQAGCDAHLIKPIERSDLIEVITAFTHLAQDEVQPENQLPDHTLLPAL